MKKYVLNIYNGILIVILILAITLLSLFCVNADKIITKNITLEYFKDSVNNYDKAKLKDFTASSENDILYKNLVNKYDSSIHSDMNDYKFNIDNAEVFGSGKYQCYFNLKNVPTCDLEHEGRYMNYLIDTTVTYKDSLEELHTRKEKGIVVFIKDGSNGNLFEWKLVRYNSYII